MNIDYAAIIQAANNRKDALQRFEAACHHLDAVLCGEYRAVVAAVEAFTAAHANLDAEAHALLPKDAAHPVAAWCTYFLNSNKELGQAYSYTKMSPRDGLNKLVGS